MTLLALIPATHALGQRICYSNDGLLDADQLSRAGLRVVSDERRRYGFPVGAAADARLWLDSLYLPALRDPARADAAIAALVRRAPVELPVPIRRLVARRN